ncbi:MAG: hypothetical protein DSY57_02780 [Desulfobulbus sp.]|nr:MAG: hypothetical protein DSY57_02780 [Desulfobulbus sp.]
MMHWGGSMELYHLRSFITVVQENHLTRAARKLHISQPAVSAHIKALEEEVGQALFFRTPSGMRVTTAGILLCRQAGVILREVEKFIGMGEDLLNRLVGTIRIGLNRNAEFLRISDLYRELRRRGPDMEIVLHQSISGTIIHLVEASELDCGFILGDCETEGLSSLALADFRLRIVGPVALAKELAGADLVALADLPWIGIPDDCPYSRIMERYFHSQGLQPRAGVVADQQAAIVSMIQSGVGLNFMLEEEAIRAEEQGQVALWPGEGFPIALSFIWRTGESDTPLIKAVRTAMLAIWPEAKVRPC